MPVDRNVARLMTIAAGVLAGVSALLPPATFFALGYQREAGGVEAEAELNASLVGRVVAESPDLWRFEQERLAEFLSRRPRRGIAEQRRVVDVAGAVVTEDADPLPVPRITRAASLLDAGVRVGAVEVSRSLRPLLLHTGIFALTLLPVSFLAFQVLRTVPLRAVRRSELALRRQRDAAQRYLDVAGVIVVLLDPAGRVSFANRKAGEVLARAPEEAIGKDWVAELVDPADRPRVAAQIARLPGAHRARPLEHAVLRPSGERRIVSWYLTLQPDRESGGDRVLCSGVDVTTERLLEEQLRHAQKMEAVGELANGVAHGFNNILSSIKGYAALLRKELPAGDPHLPDVDEILAASDRAVSLTRSLLTFSSHQRVSPEPADLGDLLRRTEPLLRSLVPEDVEVRLAIPPEPLPVRVDSIRIEQVLLGLVTNARDAMPRGGRIVVTAARAEIDAAGAGGLGLGRSGAYARVSVADTGPGIERDRLPRIFEPFFTTKEVDKGVGLGLAIAYGVMRQHGGAIGAESEPGRGATFTFFLPLLAEGDLPAETPQA